MKTEVKDDEVITETADKSSKTRGDEVLDYYLYSGRKNGRESYSIQAVQYKRGVKICQATACDVSCRYGAAKMMFDAVSEGLVEPYILCDVIYDLLP